MINKEDKLVSVNSMITKTWALLEQLNELKNDNDLGRISRSKIKQKIKELNKLAQERLRIINDERF